MPILGQVLHGVHLVIDQDLPAVHVSPVGLLAVPMMDQKAVHIAHVLPYGPLRPFLPDQHLAHEIGVDVSVDRRFDFPDEPGCHVMVRAPQDGPVDEPADLVDGLFPRRPGIAAMPLLHVSDFCPGRAGVGIREALLFVGKGDAAFEAVEKAIEHAPGHGLVFRANVLGVAEHLDDLVMLEEMQGLLHPIGTGEGHVAVDPGHVFRSMGQPRESDIDHVLFVPKLVTSPNLDMLRIVGLGDLKLPVSKSPLDGVDDGPGFLHVPLEGPVKFVPAAVAHRAGDDGDDIKEIGKHPDSRLGVGNVGEIRVAVPDRVGRALSQGPLFVPPGFYFVVPFFTCTAVHLSPLMTVDFRVLPAQEASPGSWPRCGSGDRPQPPDWPAPWGTMGKRRNMQSRWKNRSRCRRRRRPWRQIRNPRKRASGP